MLVPLLAALAASGQPVAPDRPVHLGIVLKLTHQSELDALRAAQQDPRSPDYRRWLMPAEFGKRFGQPPALVARVRAWLEAGGFQVTPYPNLSFLEATGTAGQVRALFGTQLLGTDGARPAIHIPTKPAVMPSWLAPQIVFVSGLDTRARAHHRLYDSTGSGTLGPQDLRLEYDVGPVLDAGYYGQGQELVVMSEAEAPGNEVVPADIAYFFRNLSDARASFSEHVLANPDGDFDPEPDGRLEFELDPEMQSVGAPGASSIVLDVAPASQVFTLGSQDIANNFPGATAVSVSLGVCEPQETAGGNGEILAMRQAILQGTTEGQTWTAASGDNGADDCATSQGAATVDFPAVIPEVVAIGGSQIDPVTFDANAALSAYGTEEVWNDFEIFGGDAAGAGISTIYGIPGYQSSFGFAGRSVPDLSLIGGGPYTIAVINRPGELDSIEGTSIGSPLAAGFFALIASGLGCRLGDPHTVLYNLGSAQYDGGGAAVFNDISSGDNSADGINGYTASAGFDTASGWGSMDVAALLKNWPACVGDAGTTPGSAGPSYSPCGFIGCDAGCLTLPEGPSTCDFEGCDPDDAGTCPLGTLCTSKGPYGGDGDGGVCIPGCHSQTDCIDGGVCDECFHLCVPSGNPGAAIGDPCGSPDDCPPDSTCLLFTGDFDGGYCSALCDPGGSDSACACPTGSTCYDYVTGSGSDFATCLEDCVDGGCHRPGYVCQPEGPGYASCLPACTSSDAGDTCAIYSVSGTTCDPASGACQYPTGTTGTTGTSGGATSSGAGSASSSGGLTSSAAGTSSGGTGSGGGGTGGVSSTGGSSGSSTGTPATTTGAPVADGGVVPVHSGGCGCSSGASPDVALGLFTVVLGFGRWRRRRHSQAMV